MSDRHRWTLVDLGAPRKAHYCEIEMAYHHPWACFTDEGLIDCVCGLDRPRRPSPPEKATA